MIARRIDSWIFGEYRVKTRDLAIYRILYSVVVLMLFVPRGLWLHDVPSAFFNPPIGLAVFFSGFPPYKLLVLLNIVLILSIGALLIGWKTRVASLLVGTLIIVINSWVYSLGKINHDILIAIVPLCLAFSTWGQDYSFDRQLGEPEEISDRSQGWPLSLLAFIVGVALFTAGWAKMSSGWLDPRTQSTLGFMTKNVFVDGRETPIKTALLGIESRIFWEGADWSAVLFELGFMLSVVRRKAFQFFCALGCIFHVGVYLMFGINFWMNVITYAAFCNWGTILKPTVTVTSIPVTRNPIWRTNPSILLAAIVGAGGIAILSKATIAQLLHLPIDLMVLVGGFSISSIYIYLTLVRMVSAKAHVPTSGQLTVWKSRSDSQ